MGMLEFLKGILTPDLTKALGAAYSEHPTYFVVLGVPVLGYLVVEKVPGVLSVFAFLLLGVLALAAVVLLAFIGQGVQKATIRKASERRVDLTAKSRDLAGRLTSAQRTDLKKVLEGAAQDVAQHLDLPFGLVRANLFGAEDGKLKIVDGLYHNMDSVSELTIELRPGLGSTGRSFESGRPNIAVFREDWGHDRVPEGELRKVHPRLRWILSVPVLAPGDGLKPVWVLNVDGLEKRPPQERLNSALGRLFNWSQAVSLILSQTPTPKKVTA